MALLVVVYRLADGTAISYTDDPALVATPLPPTFATKTFNPAPDLTTQVWDPPTLLFVPRPQPVHTALYQAATTLIQQDPAVTPWTSVQLANALRILLALARGQVS